jgi:pilus assembly protein CpaC
VQTEIELETGQSFAIGGLLDNRLTENLSKIPVVGDIPWLGQLFRSRLTSKSNTELIVLVTPEIVQPIPVGAPTPELKMPKAFLKDGATIAPRTPGMDVTGHKVPPHRAPIPVEELREIQRRERESAPAVTQTTPKLEFVPMQVPPASAGGAQGGSTTPASPGSNPN